MATPRNPLDHPVALGAGGGLMLSIAVILALSGSSPMPGGGWPPAPELLPPVSGHVLPIGGDVPDVLATETGVAAQQRAASLSVLDPCGLIAPVHTGQVGYTRPEKLKAGAHRGCLYHAAEAGGDMTITFTGSGVDDLQVTSADTYSIGEHEAVRIDADTRCTIVFDMGPDKAVTVQVQASANPANACQQAMAVAATIEPFLPLP